MPEPVETLWTELLSRQPERIRAAFIPLTCTEKIGVRAHLIRMTTEHGWHPEQVRSAAAALDALRETPDN